MAPEMTLAAKALQRLEERLVTQGSSLSDGARRSLTSLMEALMKGLSGQLAPAFHLASLDPGQGKSLAVAEFLKAWWDEGCPSGQGVLIGVSRLSEISTYIDNAGIPHGQFGVFTSSQELNSAGVRTVDLDQTPILFTTQQMIVSRVRGKLFQDASEFHYQGQPRALRVWDESLTPALPLVISRDELGRLLSLRLRHPDYVAAVDSLMVAISASEDGDLVDVPLSLASVRSGRGSATGAVGDFGELLPTLRKLAGQKALVVSDGGMGKAIVGVDEGLPEDFAPVVILDASGRLRSTYELWEKNRGT